MSGPRSASVGLLVGLLVAGCNPFAGPADTDSMSLQPLSEGGSVRVHRDGDELEVTDSFEIEPGDVIITMQSGARLRLFGSRTVELAPQSEVRVTDESALADPSGMILVQTKEDLTIEVEDRVEVTSRSGAFRVEGGDGSSAVLALSGPLEVRELGEAPRQVSELFEATITTGQIGSIAPVSLNRDDPWSDIYLAAPRTLQSELDGFATDLSNLINEDAIGRQVLSRVLPGLDFSYIDQFLGRGAETVNELVIAYGIARTSPSKADVAETTSRALELHRGGAQLGVVATMLGSAGPELLRELDTVGERMVEAASNSLLVTNGQAEGPPDRTTDGICANLVDCILDD